MSLDKELQASTTESMSRRGLFKNAGVIAGSAIFGSALLKTTSAGAQDANTTGGGAATGNMNGGMNGGAMNGSPDMSNPLMRTAAGGPVPGLGLTSHDKMGRAKKANDIAILNSALLLEYLESAYYTQVVAADEQHPYLTGRVKDVARILKRDESIHVQTVTDMIQELGGTPVPRPGFQFPPNVFISPVAFLALSASLEETGVGAYLGAAPLLQGKHVLNFAVAIYGNEARHTGLIHYLRGDLFAPRDLEMPITLDEALARANPFIIKDQVMPAGGA